VHGAGTVELPDGRRLAYDDVGDPAGVPVVYLHGTPDSRLARHPDDGLAAASGVRLVAVDRPGAGDSDPHPDGDLRSFGEDISILLDALGLPRASLLGWSAGGLFALAVAAHLGDRVPAVALVGALPPVEAYADRDLVAALGARRRPFVELAAEVPRWELAAEVAPFLVPQPLDADGARAHILETVGERGRTELAAVPGAIDALVRALLASVQGGLAGLQRDIGLQLEPGLDLAAVTARVRLHHGSEDDVSPPEVGAWLSAHLPDAALEVVPDAGHNLLFTHWAGILAALASDTER
jgi:pimeloyl-ACP methyl ester carboxylesterase